MNGAKGAKLGPGTMKGMQVGEILGILEGVLTTRLICSWHARKTGFMYAHIQHCLESLYIASQAT